jgi:predicted nucleic acid-binding protein
MSSILPDEKQTKLIDEIYNNIANNIYKVYIPSIFYLECDNVLLSALKRKRIDRTDYNEYINLLSLMPLNVDNFSSSTESLYTISTLANKHSLTSYDTSYFELALRMETSLATLDKNLAKKAKEANIGLSI